MANQMAWQEGRNRSVNRKEGYKELLDLGSKMESTLENESGTKILKQITYVAKRADELLLQEKLEDRIENTTEVLMDAQVIKMAHELMGSVVERMDRMEISDEEIVEAMNRTIGCNQDWNKLAEIATKISRTITRSQPMFGTFYEEPFIQEKVVKQRRKKTTNENTRQVKPVSVVYQQKEEQEARSLNVLINQIIELYENNDNVPIPYYELIIDPDNFMRTIHNAFNVSFLFRDGAIVIEKDDFQYPTVRPTSDDDKNVTFEDHNQQMVANLTTELCDEMIQRYGITEALITSSSNE